MQRYILRRLLYSLVVLLGVITVIFVAMRFIPGDPAMVYVGPYGTAEDVEAARERLGLNRPLLVQYGRYLLGALRGDFGTSYRLGGAAIDHVIQRLPKTIELAVASTFLAIVIGFPLGILAARRPGGSSWIISKLSFACQSLPTFWTGIMLIWVFAKILGLLPSWGSESWKHLILPSVSLALPFLGLVTRMVRSDLIDVLHQNYVTVARAKGVPERKVIYRHAVRNMLIPVVTIVGLQIGSLLGGAVIVENVFAWPGVGRLLITAIANRDYPVVQAATAIIAGLFILINLLVDILYTYLDPRVKVEGASR